MKDVQQQARYAQRSRALRDKSLSHGAYRLFMLLDDEGWGNTIAIPQKELAPLLDLKERQLKTLVAELVAAHYLIVRRITAGNAYDFLRQKTASIETDSAAGRGKKLPPESAENCPTYLIEPESTGNTPLPPASGGINVLSLEGAYAGCTLCPACAGDRTTGRSPRRQRVCGWCSGRGFMWPPHYATADECLERFA